MVADVSMSSCTFLICLLGRVVVGYSNIVPQMWREGYTSFVECPRVQMLQQLTNSTIHYNRNTTRVQGLFGGQKVIICMALQNF